MTEPVQKEAPVRTLVHWGINMLWIIGWIVLFFMCINVFGNSVSFIGIPLLILAMILVWYVTDRRGGADREGAE